MTATTLNTISHNADGSVVRGTITVDPATATKHARPKPTTISASAFYLRFTDGEKVAISAAAVAVPAIFAGLVHGLANSMIDLTSTDLKTWMDGLVSAGAITSDREAEIMTP